MQQGGTGMDKDDLSFSGLSLDLPGEETFSKQILSTVSSLMT